MKNILVFIPGSVCPAVFRLLPSPASAASVLCHAIVQRSCTVPVLLKMYVDWTTISHVKPQAYMLLLFVKEFSYTSFTRTGIHYRTPDMKLFTPYAV